MASAQELAKWRALLYQEQLKSMVERVGGRLVGVAGREEWVKAVLLKLNDIGIFTFQNFMRSSMRLNRLLLRSRHWQLHDRTIYVMMNDIADTIYSVPRSDEAVTKPDKAVAEPDKASMAQAKTDSK